MPHTRRVSLILLLGLIAISQAGAEDVTTLAGKKFNGKLVKIDRDGITFRVDSGDSRLSGKELLIVDFGNKVVAPRAGAKFHEIELTDGTVLRCDKFAIKGKTVAVELLPGPEGVPSPVFELQLTNVFSIARGADDPKHRAEWKQLLLNRGKRDLYVTRQTEGLIILQGTLLEGNADGTVTFEKEDGTRQNLRLSRATGGLVFSQSPPASVPPTVCRLMDVFGNTLVTQSVELNEAGLKATTVCGVEVVYPAVTGVAKLDYSQGNLAFLSDLQPQVNAPELPPEEAGKNLSIKTPYLADKAPTNEPLKLDNTIYPKGLWVQSGTVLTYTLGGDYREFKAVIGVHDLVGDSAAGVRVTIDADGRPLFSETVRRKDKPKNVTLDIKNVKQLRILVDTDTPVINGSQAIIGLAQVQK
jgi:hypothetical protein